MPDTAVDGTAHDADSLQLPQSVIALGGVEQHAGWVCGNEAVGATLLATLRAPRPW